MGRGIPPLHTLPPRRLDPRAFGCLTEAKAHPTSSFWRRHCYRLDGSLFNLRRLKAETKVSNDRIYELQYADDAAIPAHSAADLQSSLDILSTAYRCAGLLVNTKKTEVLSSVVTHALPALCFSVHGDTLSNVQEFT